MVKTHRREYFAAITYLDQHIARILEALERSGKADNTLIIFTADHGLACGQHGLMGKQNMHEHSLRVPFIIAGPGIPGGGRRHQLIYLQDAVPTTLQLAGASNEQLTGIDFSSLLPAIADAANPGRQTLYAAYTEKQRAIRDKDWKLLLYPLAKTYRIYHLAKDPLEVKDLAGTSEGDAQAKRLFSLMRTEQSQLKDDLDLVPTFPKLAESK
jgi:arylsulfatase A-like enzyme